jgi:hypothetical protein
MPSAFSQESGFSSITVVPTLGVNGVLKQIDPPEEFQR